MQHDHTFREKPSNTIDVYAYYIHPQSIIEYQTGGDIASDIFRISLYFELTLFHRAQDFPKTLKQTECFLEFVGHNIP